MKSNKGGTLKGRGDAISSDKEALNVTRKFSNETARTPERYFSDILAFKSDSAALKGHIESLKENLVILDAD